MLERVLGCEDAELHLLGHPRVIARELLQHTCAPQVDTAVADVSYRPAIGAHEKRRCGGGHAPAPRMLRGLGHDAAAGLLEGSLQALLCLRQRTGTIGAALAR